MKNLGLITTAATSLVAAAILAVAAPAAAAPQHDSLPLWPMGGDGESRYRPRGVARRHQPGRQGAKGRHASSAEPLISV